YKVNIERPKRLRSQFTEEALADLRFDKSLAAPKKMLYETYGEDVYQGLVAEEAAIYKRAEKEDWGLNKKQIAKLVHSTTWQKPKAIYDAALALWNHVGDDVFMDFNAFSSLVDEVVKKHKLNLSAAEKKTILNAISTYDATAEKVIKKVEKLSGDKLDQLLSKLGCTVDELPFFGYYSTEKAGEFITYETESDLRDSEQVSLNE